HDPARPRSLRSRFGEQIRRNRKLGFRVEVLEGPRTSVEERASFHGAYTETMHRARAAAHYFFEPEYFGTILGYERSWLLLGRSAEGAIAAGAIAALSDGLLHYYLGGTAEAHLGDSPFTNVVEAMSALAGALAPPARGAGDSAGAALRRAAPLFALALATIFCAQELTEGALAAGHPAGLGAVLAHGGWVFLPLALADWRPVLAGMARAA